MNRNITKSSGVNIVTERTMIENMTYDDYLSSVYTYEEASADSLRAQAELDSVRCRRDECAAALRSLKSKDEEIRRRYNEIINADVKQKKELWKKSQARFDFKLSNRKAVASQTAKNDIQNKKDEYASELKKAQEQEHSLKKHLAELETDHTALKEEQKRFANFTGKSFPPTDHEALAVLERARDKRLLTKFQREMLEGNVNKLCDRWIKGFDGLTSTEKKFVSSEFYSKLVEGKVTPEVIRSLANAASAVFAALLLIIIAMTFAVEPNAFTMVLRTAVSTFALGGLFASGSHLLREKVEAVRFLPIPEKVMLVTAFVLGCTAGFFIGAYVYAPAPGASALIYSAAAAASCVLLFRRFLLTRLAARALSKFSFLKDKARKNIFAEYETLEDGLYNFMIFCYLKHDAVLQYLSMQYTQSEIAAISEKLDFNRKDSKYYTEQLAAAKQKYNDLKNGRGDLEAYERRRNEQLAAELAQIEAERPAEPDFAEEAKKNCEAQLAPLKAELSALSADISEKENSLRVLEEEFNESCEQAIILKAQKKRIAAALRSWKKTPMPASTDYKLLDAFCLDTKTKISIIHHDLKPYVLRYSSSGRAKSPSEALAPLLYRCVRGLCKINPRRLLQVNIFDYVSDPEVLLNAASFRKLSERGVIEGIYSMKEFEMRLFSNSEGYSTFKELFKLRCGKVGSVIKEHRSEIRDDVKPDLALANSFVGESGELFLYQICMFIVPREGEGDRFRPPKGILDLIDRDSSARLGILPLFFADSDSVAHEWIPVIEKYGTSDYIFPIN